MHFRAHLIAAAAVGLARYPRSPRRALLTALSGVLLDVDHLLLYASRSGDWSLAGAARYERRRHRLPRPGDTRPRYGSLRSVAHRPELTLPLAWLAGLLWPALQPIALGLSVHLALDQNVARLDWRIWRRAGGRCEGCGVAGLPRDAYYLTMPRAGGSRWSLANRRVLCPACARALWLSRRTKAAAAQE